MCNLCMQKEAVNLKLLHIFREPPAEEQFMGRRFMEDRKGRLGSVLAEAKDKLVKSGYSPEKIRAEMTKATYPTITDGIIEHFKRERFDMVVIGRKQMSKAEEFVRGDISVKLVRALEDTAVLVIKSP